MSFIQAGASVPVQSRDVMRAFHMDNLALYLKKSDMYSEELITEIANELDSLLTFNRKFISSGDQELKKHTYTALVAVALSNVFKKHDHNDEKIEEVILGNFRLMVVPIMLPLKKRMEKSEDPWSKFLPYARDGTVNAYSTFNPEILKADDNGLSFDLQHCVFYDVFKRNNSEHLGPVFCKYDFILADLVQDMVTFKREETIATGGCKCTFRYCPKGKEAAMDW